MCGTRRKAGGHLRGQHQPLSSKALDELLGVDKGQVFGDGAHKGDLYGWWVRGRQWEREKEGE